MGAEGVAQAGELNPWAGLSAAWLIVPGYTNSGPEHWQSHWERLLPGARRVQQLDWERPSLDLWVAALDAEVVRASEPPVLIAHSLGVTTVIHWAAVHRRAVRGALLVGPPDLDQEDTPSVLKGFSPVPHGLLAFPSVVVASRNDPFASFIRVEQMSREWGARLVDAGSVGHLNTASGLGVWPSGQGLLRELLQKGDP